MTAMPSLPPSDTSIIMTTGHCVQLVAFSYMTGFMITVTSRSISFHMSLSVAPMSWTTFSVTSHQSSNCLQRHVHSWACGSCFGWLSFLSSSHHYHFPIHCLHHSAIPSTQGKEEGLSTCASPPHGGHNLLAQPWFSGMSRAIASFNSNKLISAVYAVLTPMLNPFIYCLRNQEVKKNAIKKTVGVGQCLLFSWGLLPWEETVPDRRSFPWHDIALCF